MNIKALGGRPLSGRVCAVVIWLGSVACGGGEPAASRDAGSALGDEVPGAVQSAAVTTSPEEAAALATAGEGLFVSKGCIGCHTIGRGRLTGPDLKGVTERREAGWIVAMMTNPDSMLKNDVTARQLFAEYMTPMLNMGVTPEDARALYEYLRAQQQ